MLSRFALAPTSRFLVQKSLLSTSTNAHLIVNAVGKDRLGIVSEISKHVTDIGGNVGESQATKLGKHFSMMMIVDVPQDQRAALEDLLQNLEGMNTTVFETEADTARESTPQIGYAGRFELEGANYPGIVHQVTSFLAQNGLSVDRLETSDEIAPHGGTTLFKMKGVATAYQPLAAGFNVEEVKEKMTKLGDDLNCDLSMEDMKAV